MTHYVVVFARPFAQVWGTVVRADRHESDGETHRLYEGEKVVYQIPVALARSVERCAHQREAERRLRDARQRPRTAGRGTLHVEEAEETHPRPGYGMVERRSFSIDERIISGPGPGPWRNDRG